MGAELDQSRRACQERIRKLGEEFGVTVSNKKPEQLAVHDDGLTDVLARLSQRPAQISERKN